MAIKYFNNTIPGLKVIDCPSFVDDRGFLMEILRSTDGDLVPGDEFGHSQADVIRQVYLVQNPLPTIRAFHAHDDLIDYFCVVQGSAIFAFADDRDDQVERFLYSWRVHHPADDSYAPDSEKAKLVATQSLGKCVQRVVTSARKPQVIVVPAGVYHGWKSLEPETIMVSVGSRRYNTKTPDEVRISPNALDDAFRGSPWEVEGK